MRSSGSSRLEGRSFSVPAGVLSGLGRNFGWLAGSTGFSAIASLVYVGLTARTLGPSMFGSFALIMTYGELVANLAQFQSWKAVVGFGAVHKEAGNASRLGRLFGYAASLDWIGGAAGSLITIAALPFIGRLLGWSAGDQAAATWFAPVLLLTSSTAPAGMLRLFDRFDLQAYSETIAQLVRLAGCIMGWALGSGLSWFLCVWALAALFQLLAQWICVMALGQRTALGIRAFRLAFRENPGIWPFMLKTNLSGSLSWLWMQCGTLVVGARAGPVEAGGFRLAYRFSLALMKPVEIAAKALLPELARLAAASDNRQMRRLLLQVSLISGMLGAVMLAAAGIWGREILRLVAGSDFEFARHLLFLLSIAAAINVAGFALEPFHNAHFRAGTVLRAYVMAAFVYGGLLAYLLPTLGARSAAFASIGASCILVVQLGVSAARMLRTQRHEPDLLANVEPA